MGRWLTDLLARLCLPSRSVTIICLASSRKYGGRCLAGLRTDYAGWIRPVGDSVGGALTLSQCQFPDGTEASVLDIITLYISTPCPKPYQPENWRLHRVWYNPWFKPCRLAYRSTSEDARDLLQAYLVTGPDLLGNTSDRIDSFGLTASASLALITPNAIQWLVQVSTLGKRQTRARFRLGSVFYNLAVTDPIAEGRLAVHPPGLYTPEEAGYQAGEDVLFTVSLGEPTSWDQCCYKLIAGVLVL